MRLMSLRPSSACKRAYVCALRAFEMFQVSQTALAARFQSFTRGLERCDADT